MNIANDPDAGNYTTLQVGPRQYFIRDFSSKPNTHRPRGAQPSQRVSRKPQAPVDIQDISPVDKDGNDITEVHGIPIVKTDQGTYRLVFRFPAILSESVSDVAQTPLPHPTEGMC